MAHEALHKRIRFAFLIVQLAVWAQIGVITRYYLDKIFTLGCGGSWGPCLSGGIYFSALPSNMLGSFVIGVFAASDTLGLQSAKPMALLPPDHSWQHNLELQIGIRTGFCGCLTTFASWIVELMTNAILYNTWMNALVGLIVGLHAALISYILGTHVALFVERWVLASRQDVLEEQAAYRQVEVDAFRGGSLQESLTGGLAPEQAELESLEPDLPRISPRPWLTEQRSGLSERQSAALGRGSASRRLSARQIELEALQPDLPRIVQRRSSLGPQAQDALAQGVVADAEGDGKAAQLEAGGASKPLEQLEEGVVALKTWNKTDFVALAALVALTTWFAVGLAVQDRSQWLREIWLSCLLGPFGCLLRWYLSRFNYRLPFDALAWLPAGTLAANVLGTAISLGMQCVLQRGNPGYWGVVGLAAVQNGFCGSLTTVSTLVTEIVKFVDVFPDSGHTYTYTAVTFGAGIVLSLVVFGWAGWA